MNLKRICLTNYSKKAGLYCLHISLGFVAILPIISIEHWTYWRGIVFQCFKDHRDSSRPGLVQTWKIEMMKSSIFTTISLVKIGAPWNFSFCPWFRRDDITSSGPSAGGYLTEIPCWIRPHFQAKVVSGPQADTDVAVKVIELEESLELRRDLADLSGFEQPEKMEFQL